MEAELNLRIVLETPPAGVDFGLQSGKGNDYETIHKQRSRGKDLAFDFAVTVKNNRSDGLPNFLGPFAQGPLTNRFIYIDVGQYAGQADSIWARRIKVPLTGIDWELINEAKEPKTVLETRFPGTGKDGGPTCASVRGVRWTLTKKTKAAPAVNRASRG